MAQFYADENFNYGVVAELRRLGHDVRTVQEAGRRGQDDATVLADATLANRAVLTHNRIDFVWLHRDSTAHSGIIVCSEDTDTSALAVRIHKATSAAFSLHGQLIRVNRPATP